MHFIKGIRLLFVLIFSACLLSCSGGSNQGEVQTYQGTFIDAGEYTLGYSESVLQIAQEAAELVNLLNINPGNTLQSPCSSGGNISIILSDINKDGVVSDGDHIETEYNDCFRGAIQEKLAGNLSIVVQESRNSQYYELLVSFESLKFIVTSFESLEISGSMFIEHINNEDSYSLSVSAGENNFKLTASDQGFSLQESFESFRLTKTINLQTQEVENSVVGLIRSPIFPSSLSFSSKEMIRAEVDQFPTVLLIEFSLLNEYPGTVTSNSSTAIVRKLGEKGEIINQSTFSMRNVLEGSMWNNPLADDAFPIRYLSKIHTAGEWQQKEALDSRSEFNARPSDFVFGKNKNMFAVWQHQDEQKRQNVYGSRYIHGQGWEPGQLLDTTDAGHAAFANIVADSEGNAIAVWIQNDGTVINLWGARYSEGSGWQSAELLETDTTQDARFPDIGIDGSGNALVVWEQSGSDSHRIFSKTYLKGNGWQSTQLVASVSGRTGSMPKIHVNKSGDALVVWRRSRNPDNSGYLSVMGAHYSNGSGWGHVALIDEQNIGQSINHEVILDNEGNGVAVWEQNDGHVTNIMYNRYIDGSGWQGAKLLETDDQGYAGNPQITFDKDMTPNVIWNQIIRTRNGALKSQILLSKLISGLEWSPFKVLSSEYESAFKPTIAFDAKGNAIAQWQVNAASGKNYIYKRLSNSKWSESKILVESASGLLMRMLNSGEAASIWAERNESTFRMYSGIYE